MVINLEAGVAKLQRDMQAVSKTVSDSMGTVQRDSARALQAVEQGSARMAQAVDESFGQATAAAKGLVAVYSGFKVAELARDATLAAARYETMGVAMTVV
ncbi:hypothetical protein QR66_19270, partial [Chromobacterium piscinae]